MYIIYELESCSLMQAFENLADKYGRECGINDLWQAALLDGIRFTKDGYISTFKTITND